MIMGNSMHWHGLGGRLAVMGLLGYLLSIGSTASAGHGARGQQGDVPVRLVGPTGPVGYPDPICLGCKKPAREEDTAASMEDGILRLAYEDDQVPTFSGDLVLTVVLRKDGARRVVVLEGVVLVDGHTTELELEDGEDWTWDDVGVVWLELMPVP